MPIDALVTPGGSAFGLHELDDSETEPGAIIRRPGQPRRGVMGPLDDDRETAGFDVLIAERAS